MLTVFRALVDVIETMLLRDKPAQSEAELRARLAR